VRSRREAMLEGARARGEGVILDGTVVVAPDERRVAVADDPSQRPGWISRIRG